jgi:hypothetical protein
MYYRVDKTQQQPNPNPEPVESNYHPHVLSV